MLVHNFYDTSPQMAQLFGSKPVYGISFLVDMSNCSCGADDDDPYEVDLDDDNVYTPTSWEQEYEESDEDYRERMEDQESLLEYYS